MICLDSSFLVDHLRGEDYTRTFLNGIEADVRILIPTVVLHELYTGALRGSSTRTVPNIRNALGTAEFAPFDDAAAEEAAQIRSTLADRGDLINPLDMLIAGIARDADATVVAVDRDYERVPDLSVRNPKTDPDSEGV